MGCKKEAICLIIKLYYQAIAAESIILMPRMSWIDKTNGGGDALTTAGKINGMWGKKIKLDFKSHFTPQTARNTRVTKHKKHQIEQMR